MAAQKVGTWVYGAAVFALLNIYLSEAVQGTDALWTLACLYASAFSGASKIET